MKKIFCAGLLFFSATPALTQDSDLDQLKKLNARFIHNFVTSDTASHSRILHKNFVCINTEGQVIQRAKYLLNWSHGFEGFVYFDYRSEDIQLFGSTALVHSQNKYIVVRDGKEITGLSLYTDTYVKESGQWKCVQAQLSKVSPQYFAGDETIIRKYDFRKSAN